MSHCLIASTFFSCFPSPPPPPPPLPSSSSSSKPQIFAVSCSSSSMDANIRNPTPPRFMDFPYLSPSHRDLMTAIVSSVESRLQPLLLPCTLPPDVQFFCNQTGTSQSSLHIRSGRSSSPIDFILGSWIHSGLPSGGALDITTLSAYLNASTNAPHFLIELIRSSPTSMIMVLDLPPRKDLVLYPDYLQTFYEDTELDKKRQLLENISEVQPYVSSSLFIRCAFSPTAVLVRIDTKGDGPRMEQIIQEHLSPIAEEVLSLWLDQCACVVREVSDEEKHLLHRRDSMFKNKAIEVDLVSSLPRLFGPDVAERVIRAIREVSKP